MIGISGLMHRCIHTNRGLLPSYRGIAKNDHEFADHYGQYFQPLHDQPIRLLEFGVMTGASLKVWEDFFIHPETEIIGIDRDQDVLQYIPNKAKIILGDLNDQNFRDHLKTLGEFDIIIDDAGHTMKQQITLFRDFFPKVKSQGIYICEDLHTSYFQDYQKNPEDGNMIQFLKDLIDPVNILYWKEDKRSINFTDQIDIIDKTIYTIHFYESIGFIFKR